LNVDIIFVDITIIEFIKFNTSANLLQS